MSEESPEGRQEIHIGKKTLVFLVGLPGSGKSTFAIEHFPLDAIISTDKIRQELTNNQGNQLISDRAFQLAARIAEERLSRGEIAVLDAQNLREGDRASFYQVAKRCGADVEAIFLNVGAEESIVRARKRKKKVPEEYIRGRKDAHRVALRSLQKSEHVSRVHVLEADAMDRVNVILPEDDAEDVLADRELLREAEAAEMFIAGSETGFLRKEAPEGFRTLSIDAGSVFFVERETNERTEKFLLGSFLPHQIIDVEQIARRLGTDVHDEAVRDVAQFILKERTYHNLTSVVSYPATFPFMEDLRTKIQEAGRKRDVTIPAPLLKIEKEGESTAFATGFGATRDPSFIGRLGEEDSKDTHIEVIHDAPKDTPLFVVGDIQGCYRAMRELASQIRQENIVREKEGEGKRMIVFVGDMADRGPHDAEAVIYISALVRAKRAVLVKGNHDENLLRGLRGEEVRSQETRSTVEELQKRLKPASIQKIVKMLERAPAYARWEHLAVVHASLLRIPRKGERLPSQAYNLMMHGARSGRFVGGRAEVWKLPQVVAHDPDILVVGGHTHEKDPVMDMGSGAGILDTSVEIQGKLWGMYYPELELASAEEPAVLRMYRMLTGKELPQGEDLLLFMEYARQQGFIDVKPGEGDYEGLLLNTYSSITEVSNVWDTYPVLRHFRGLILDTKGNIVARPFSKTHKAGEEIPLEQLRIVPEKVFEKLNGSLVIAYFWKDAWRVATKFSFENKDYTKPASTMLSRMNTSVFDPSRTYCFEIILPNDSHIVDYKGKQSLVLLNSIVTQTGVADDWEDVRKTADRLGAETARDMTPEFLGMTIADIHRVAQEEGKFINMEGVMALYEDKNGEKTFVKIKAREYSDKKFVRDHLQWKDIIKAFDEQTMEVPDAKKEEILFYNFDNHFARSALEARIQWIQQEYHAIVREVRELIFSPLTDAERIYNETIAAGEGREQAIENAMRHGARPSLESLLEKVKGEALEEDKKAMMGFVRDMISGRVKPETRLLKYALGRIEKNIEAETRKRGKNSFWIVPNQ